MSLRRILLDLAKVVADEAERNPPFSRRLHEVVENFVGQPRSATIRRHKDEGLSSGAPRTLPLDDRKLRGSSPEKSLAGKRPSNRRPAAVLDPISIAKEGEAKLRLELTKLQLSQLLDIVAEYGFDPGKLVMKWKDANRVAERILQISLARAQKGSAFLEGDHAASVESDEEQKSVDPLFLPPTESA